MRTSRKTDYRLSKDFRSSKDYFLDMTYPGQRPEPPSLSPHFILVSLNSLGADALEVGLALVP